MKKIQLFGLLAVALAIAFIVTYSTENVSQYTDFATAERLIADGNDNDVHVVGKLPKDASGQIMGMSYNPSLDANRFEFTLIDDKKREQKVIYNNPKPQDFDKSDQVVIIGKMDGQIFKCNKILLKCPSKYQNEKPEFKEAKS
jgi:cytochrome c-type biogenesis protein CcmE